MQGDGTAVLAAAHRYWSWLEDGLNLIAAAAIFFLMFVGVFQIIGRTVFDTAIYGYIDYMEQASALFAFLGIAYAQRVGAHIRMDLLLRGFSLRFLWSMELLENEHVRVLEYRDMPGEKTHRHYHPAFVLYAQGPFKRTITLPDGKVIQREFKAGDVIYSDAQTHVGANTGDAPTHVIMVEIKADAKNPAAGN